MSHLLPPGLFPWVCFLLPLLLSWLLTASLLRLAPRLGLVDHPSARKVHTQRTPSGGGLAVYLALVVSALCLLPGQEGETLRVLAFGMVILVLGLIDDLRPLPWQLRLGVQTATAGVAVFTLPTDLTWMMRLGAILWIVGLTNAFNMLDNMDALSAGVAWIAAALLAVAAFLRQEQAPDWDSTLRYLMLMGTLSGFLWFNQPPARIFMGDAGSTFLGFFLGLSSLEIGLEDYRVPQRWAVAPCILAVPWYDMTSVVILRLWQGKSPFHADKLHLSHRLVQLGLGPPLAVCVIYFFALASGAAGLLLYQVSRIGAVLVGVQLACWWIAVAAVEYIRHYHSPHGQDRCRGDGEP
jgi:UDP-GlcNAc:undecaprenyl-phosphate GlcNAc-1-phosphate transferase